MTKYVETHGKDYIYDCGFTMFNLRLELTQIRNDNGNLLSDGTNTYTYDSANRLTIVSNQSSVSSYQYNGLGDRYQQTVGGQTTTYALDLNSGLTQVLDDGESSYLYGLGRVAQVNTTTEYFLGDALGSVRQLTSQSGQVTYAKSYDPYGVVTNTSGADQTAYGYTGEQQNANGMVYLRARHYNPDDGRFLSRDTWGGIYDNPATLNRFSYAHNNPVMNTDPSGHCIFAGVDTVLCAALVFVQK